MKRANSLGGAPHAGRSERGVPDECGWDVKRGNSSGGARRKETGVPDERGWDVKRGNSVERRTSVDGM